MTNCALGSRKVYGLIVSITTVSRGKPVISAVLCLLLCMAALLSVSGCSVLSYTTFRGKVIDAQTLMPIEGVVVVAEWDECWPGIGAGELCDFDMVKETLTDKNGDWSITGPAGEEPTEFGYIRGALSFVIHYTRRPRIQTYKRGYIRNDQGFGRFEAFPFIRKDQGLEGIILIRPGDTREEAQLFVEKYGGIYWPFIPMKDPEKRLQELNFDFKYPQKIQDIESEGRKLRPDYIVYGLSRAKTSKDFMNAPSLLLHMKATGKLKILPKIIERDSLEDFKGYD